MKGIILAGGLGSRLFPLTRAVSKQLLPVYDRPMIYFPLCTLMAGGIRDILVISDQRSLPAFRTLMKDGSQWGVRLSYAVQPRPEGIAQALVIAKAFIGIDAVALALGDNIICSSAIGGLIAQGPPDNGALIFCCEAADATAYGVVALDATGVPVSLEEKPVRPASNLAVIGLYLYGADAVGIAEALPKSKRQEYEITDVNKAYLARQTLRVERLGPECAWFDAGTPQSLLAAANHVAALEKGPKGLPGPEHIAYARHYITKEELRLWVSAELANSHYGERLEHIAAPRRNISQSRLEAL